MRLMRLMSRLGQSALIMFLVADAALLLLLGRRWVRFTRFGKPSSAYFQLMTWFLKWPEAGLRLLGAAEALLAARLFHRWERYYGDLRFALPGQMYIVNGTA